MSTNADIFSFQCGNCDCTCCDKTCGDTSGEVTAATEVLKAVILNGGGKIGMTGTCFICKLAVITAVLVLIFDNKRNRSSRSFSVEDSADYFYCVSLMACGGDRACCFAEVHLRRNKFLVNMDSGGKSVENGSYHFSVTFAEDSNGNA